MILDVRYVEDFAASNNGTLRKGARVVKIFTSVQVKRWTALEFLLTTVHA